MYNWWKFLEQLNDYLLLMEDHMQWSQVVNTVIIFLSMDMILNRIS